MSDFMSGSDIRTVIMHNIIIPCVVYLTRVTVVLFSEPESYLCEWCADKLETAVDYQTHMKQHKDDSQKQLDERTLMLDGQPKSETALNITNSNQADTTTSCVATLGSTDDSTYVDVKPVISDVCGGVDCPGTLAPKSSELSNTLLDEITVKNEYECTCNDDKTIIDCTDVVSSFLNADEVSTVNGIKEENLWTSTTTTEALNTTGCHVDHEGKSKTLRELLQNETTLSEEMCEENEIQTSNNEKYARYRSVEQISFSRHLNQHYSTYNMQYNKLFIDRCWICQKDYDSNKCLRQHVDSHCNSWVPYSKDAYCIS